MNVSNDFKTVIRLRAVFALIGIRRLSTITESIAPNEDGRVPMAHEEVTKILDALASSIKLEEGKNHLAAILEGRNACMPVPQQLTDLAREILVLLDQPKPITDQQKTTSKFLASRLGSEEYGIDTLEEQQIRSYESPACIATAPSFTKGLIKPAPDMHRAVDTRFITDIASVAECMPVLTGIEALVSTADICLIETAVQ